MRNAYHRSGGPGSIPSTTRKKSSGSGTWSTQPREYNWGATWWKSSGSCLENREYGHRDPSRWPRGTLYPQKLAITSPTSDGRSVGIVRSRTQTMEFVCFCFVFLGEFNLVLTSSWLQFRFQLWLLLPLTRRVATSSKSLGFTAVRWIWASGNNAPGLDATMNGGSPARGYLFLDGHSKLLFQL
jgi:hypothetical protein